MKEYFKLIVTGSIGCIIGGLFIFWVFQRDPKKEAYEAANKVETILLEKLPLAKTQAEQEFLAYLVETNLKTMGNYYDKEEKKDCLIGKRIVYALKILIDKSSDENNIAEYRKTIESIEKKSLLSDKNNKIIYSSANN